MQIIENVKTGIYELVDPITFNNLLDQGKPWSGIVFFAGVIIFLAVFIYLVRKINSSLSYQFADQVLVVPRFLGCRCILFSTITEVKRVRRNDQNEVIRVTFRKAGRRLRINIKPQDSLAFVYDLVSRCPQLKGCNVIKLKRNASFRDAIASTA